MEANTEKEKYRKIENDFLESSVKMVNYRYYLDSIIVKYRKIHENNINKGK